jgi:hypothetical protein
MATACMLAKPSRAALAALASDCCATASVAPLSVERLLLGPNGSVTYQVKATRRDKATERVMAPNVKAAGPPERGGSEPMHLFC